MSGDSRRAEAVVWQAIVAADPVAANRVPPRGHDVDAVIDRIVTQPVRSSRRRGRWRPRTFVALLGLAGTVAVGGTVAADLLDDEVENAAAPIMCVADLDSMSGYVLSVDGSDPVDACRERWNAGALPVDGPAPADLTPCVSADGTVMILPGPPGVCVAEGMANWTEPTPTAVKVGELQRQLMEASTDRCADPAEIEQLAEQTLAELDLDGWSVLVQPSPSPDAGCAAIGIDTASSQVVIVSLPGAAPTT